MTAAFRGECLSLATQLERYAKIEGMLPGVVAAMQESAAALRLVAKPAEEVRETAIVAAMSSHFKSVIEASAGQPFAETDVHLPVKSFEGYAAAICKALSTPGQPKP